jgi:hypothetical protein
MHKGAQPSCGGSRRTKRDNGFVGARRVAAWGNPPAPLCAIIGILLVAPRCFPAA